MKKISIVIFVMSVFLVLNVEVVFASGTQTEGQGTRALGMGGAFIAVADSPEAVFYNPAGLTQIKKADAPLYIISINPKNKYTHAANGVKNESDQPVIAPTMFVSLPISLKDPLKEHLYFGFGMYAPFAREADYNADTVGSFGNAYAKTLRTDYSPILAYKINEDLSVGAGFIAGFGKTKQNFQTAYGNNVYINDELDGWGFSGLLGILWNVNKQLKIGGVYRGRMNISETGQREQTPGFSATHASADVHYPAQAGLGLAYMPNEKLTLACDFDWTDWKYLYKVVTKIDSQPDSTTIADAHDTVEYHLGGEYKINPSTALRAGFAYIPAAFPGEWINPAKPDYDKWYLISLGASKSWKNLEFSFLYEYLWSNKWDVTDNAALYNGRYEFNMHVVGIGVSYKF